jgi:zinc protease
MDEGTASRSSLDLARAAEGMGTHLSTSCGWDGAFVNVQCLAPHLPASLDLAVDVLRNPSFPQLEWERVHGQSLAALRAERDSAESRAYRGLLAALYGEDHPYRLPIDGEEATIGRLARQDVIQFHGRYHGPSDAAIVVSGDVDADAIATALDARLDGWEGPEVARPKVATPPRGQRPRIILLDRPGAPQAVVRAGHVGLARRDAEYTDALVLNHVLGGQFTSRLNERLREIKGFTYGVRSHFDCRRGAGPFSIGAAFQSDRLAEALDDLYREVVALRSDRPPTEKELDDARRSLIEGQARHFETPSALVARYAGLIVHDLPSDHHAQFAERLDAVTIDSLTVAAQRQLVPSALVVIVVADAELAAPQLETLSWADFERRDG